MKLCSLRLIILAVLLCVSTRFASAQEAPASVEQWGTFDLPLKATATGNPFDVKLTATFTLATKKIEVSGFYDGDGTFRVRFMPTEQGDWQYQTQSDLPALNGKTGRVTSTKPSPNNHGPVKVARPVVGPGAPAGGFSYHFAYSDGTPYYPFGTTSYAWTSQGDVLEEQTLATLKTGPFNKIRMCVFPKRYDWNHNEPVFYPFEGTPRNFDFTKFNPAFFQHLEKRIGQLRDMNIESDLIIFHPYDRNAWGFDRMGAANDDRYLRYLVARLSSYRNIWWSLANEFDFMAGTKFPADWERFFQILVASDPYAHLRSLHNGAVLYNATHSWATHASIQNGSAVEDVGRAWLFRQMYQKPVLMDEVKYEGNISSRWGQLSGEEMTYRFWIGMISGVYVTHGETVADPPNPPAASDPVLWWAKGGTLRGTSPPRIAFLRKIVEAGQPLDVIDYWEDLHLAGRGGRYYLRYLGKTTPTEWVFELPRPGVAANQRYKVEIIDTWNMTITPVDHVFEVIPSPLSTYRFRDKNNTPVKLPGKPYMALRITRVE